MSGYLKRKSECQEPCDESSQKRACLAETPKPVQFMAQDFHQQIYTPIESLLPSPFGVQPELDANMEKILKQFGPVVETTYKASSAADNRSTLRQKIQDTCSSEDVVWVDPLLPLVLGSGEGLSLTHRDGSQKVIRMKRVIDTNAFQWFAYVQEGTKLTVNGQLYPSHNDFVVGPIPSFSIIEYDDRAVFLYVDRQSVDYRPSGADKSTLTEYGLRFVNGLGSDIEQALRRQGNAATDTSSGNEPTDNRITLRVQPEKQPEDVDSCSYFRWRMDEWKLLRKRSNVTVDDAAEPVRLRNSAEWLVDTVMFRAIASVTTAIELENGVPFAQIDEGSYQLARDGAATPVVGCRGDLLLPFNTNNGFGAHWLLVHVKDTTNGPEIHCYDSGGSAQFYKGPIKTVVRYLLWYGGDVADQPSPEITHHPAARQPAGWECGYFTILNAWCVALGMTPSAKLGSAVSPNRIPDVIDMINLAISGFMDSATIRAFLRCVDFVDSGPDTIADDRHFTRTVPFLNRFTMGRYVQERRRIERNPHSPTDRLDLETIRFILHHSSPLIDINAQTPNEILTTFDTWLKHRRLIPSDDQTPLSPVSPATIRLTFALAESVDEVRFPYPDDARLRRKIWNIYHKLLKKQGHLGTARKQRGEEKAAGSSPTQESAPPGDLSYPYEDTRLVVLNRLDMLPTSDVLSAHEIANIRARTGPPRIKINFKKYSRQS
ncbi:hypothetical protein E4T39_05127 [Aureobasidium subglaciale]|nr:hypothetical protein E4T39_05127 [Aureobasidium subglaciale]